MAFPLRGGGGLNPAKYMIHWNRKKTKRREVNDAN
jgi:hypothetical protein